MAFSRTALLLGFTLLGSAPFASAQLISRTFDVTGASNHVVARFTIWINATANTYVVDINNALPAASGAKVGTITGFGFNTPFSVASQASDNPGTVVMKAKWTQVNSGHGVPTSWSGDDYWSEQTPYALPPSYSNDYGVEGTPNRGVEYGEKATFVFTFNAANNDITAANFAGFFNNNSATAIKFDFTVRWQEVDTKNNYLNNCFDGPGSDKGGSDLLAFSDGELPPAPEPSTYGLMGAAALVGLIAHRHRSAKKRAALSRATREILLKPR
jgi:hypothetical protein